MAECLCLMSEQPPFHPPPSSTPLPPLCWARGGKAGYKLMVLAAWPAAAGDGWARLYSRKAMLPSGEEEAPNVGNDRKFQPW